MARIIILILLAVAISGQRNLAQACGNRDGSTDCPFDEAFVGCAQSHIGSPSAGNECPESRYVLTSEEFPCGQGTCSATSPPCAPTCSPGSQECCEGRPKNGQGVALYTTNRCWPFIDFDGDSYFDKNDPFGANDEPLAFPALWAACKNNLARITANGQAHGKYVTFGETRPLGVGRWHCTTEFGTTDCPSGKCHTITLMSDFSLSTPANAPNGQHYFGDINKIHFDVVLGGDFINQSCSGWKDHASDHSLTVEAANILLGGTLVSTHIVYDLKGQYALSFEAKGTATAPNACIIGGNHTGLDTSKVGSIPNNELDCTPTDVSEIRKHGSVDGPSVLVKAPAWTDGAFVDLAYSFPDDPAPSSPWKLKAADGGVCAQGYRLFDADFAQMTADCKVRILGDPPPPVRYPSGICEDSFCAVPPQP